MKKRYLMVGMMAASVSAFGQTGAAYQKRDLPQTEVQMIYAFYTQDGLHSAVTGGLGTENLQVYSAQLSAAFHRDSTRTYRIDAGSDLISSASTDRIDYVMSSASRQDFRVYAKAGYERNSRGLTAGLSGLFSFESDYQSRGVELQLNHSNGAKTRSVSLEVQALFDDLRWYDHGKHDKLIYPVELRGTEWFDITRRNSLNVSFGYIIAINRRVLLGIYPGLSYQAGLLSTPFHRVYFDNGSKRVETLPGERLKFPLRLQLNSFVGGRWIIRSGYRFYHDDFGITAHTIELEAPLKINPAWTLTPLVRLYRQTASGFFRPYGLHDITQSFHTSDYDLSAFESYKVGLAARYAPFTVKGRHTFRAVELRYAFYHRSDGLAAHVITTFFDLAYKKR